MKLITAIVNKEDSKNVCNQLLKWQLQHPEIVVLKYAVKHIGQQ